MSTRKKWFLVAIGLVILLYPVRLVFQKAFVEAYRNPSSSMENTILYKESFLAISSAYSLRVPLTDRVVKQIALPQRSDVIVFRYPDDPSKTFVKRIIGLPGDKLEIRKTRVYINDTLMNEPYAVFKPEYKGLTAEDFGPITVPPESYFTLGDNRDNSKDSRTFGCVPLKLILGKASRIYWSRDPDTKTIRWERMGISIH